MEVMPGWGGLGGRFPVAARLGHGLALQPHCPRALESTKPPVWESERPDELPARGGDPRGPLEPAGVSLTSCGSLVSDLTAVPQSAYL